MGAQHSHLLYQVPSPATYSEDLPQLQWVEGEGMRIPLVHQEWKSPQGKAYVPKRTPSALCSPGPGHPVLYLQSSTLVLTIKTSVAPSLG